MSAGSVGRAVAVAPRYLAIGLIRTYQYTVSPLTGPTCKYYPSCSHYGVTALTHHGFIKGFALASWRVLRCNPWSYGGVDDVPERGAPLFNQPFRGGARNAPSPSAPLHP